MRTVCPGPQPADSPFWYTNSLRLATNPPMLLAGLPPSVFHLRIFRFRPPGSARLDVLVDLAMACDPSPYLSCFALWLRYFAWLLLAAGTLDAASAEPAQNVPPSPLIAQPPNDPAMLSAGFGLPDGFVAKLFAAEPDLANPVSIAVDPRGRCFVAETFSFGKRLATMAGIDQTAVHAADVSSLTLADREAAIHRLLGERVVEWDGFTEQVRLLEDPDGDGQADRASVFAAGFNDLLDGHGSGVLVRGDDVFFTCVPALWRLRDTDADGVANQRTPLQLGFGVREGLRGHDLHGLVIGPDQRLYFSLGDRGYHVAGPDGVLADAEAGGVFRCELDGSRLELVAGGLRNPQGLAFDDAGNLFTVDNNGDFGDRSRLVQIVPGGDSGWRSTLHSLPDRGPFGREQLWHLPHDGQPAWIVPPLAHMPGGPAGLDFYPGTGLPPHFTGRFLLADFLWTPAASSIQSFRLKPVGAAFEAWSEEQTFQQILATDVKFGPDGAIWVANWVEPQADGARGRIWRFLPVDDGSPEAAERTIATREVQALLAGEWASRAGDDLVALLSHADRRVRCEAQWELARRGDADRLIMIVDEAVEAIARRHAAWGLEQIGRVSGDTGRATVEAALVSLMHDTAWENRVVACRCLGDLGTSAAVPAMAALLEDPQPHVVAAAALALGRIGDSSATDGIVACLRRAAAGSGIDPHLRHALAMGLLGTADAAGLKRLASDDNPEIRLAACLAMRRRRAPEIAVCLHDADPRIAVEAARAIHDVPIPAATGELIARLADGPADGPEGDAFLRRAISAADREGSAGAAALVARCAARRDVSTACRLEALDVLGAWGNPPPQDRVLAAWRPPAAREVTAARAAIAATLPEILSAAEADPAVFTAALSTAAAVGSSDVGPLLADSAADDGRDPQSRAAALEALATLEPAAALDRARGWATAAEIELRLVSRRVRAEHGSAANIVPELVAIAMDSASGLVLTERQEAVELVAAIDGPEAIEGLTALAAALGEERLGTGLDLEVLQAVEKLLGVEAAATLRGIRERSDAAGGVPSGWHEVAWGGDVDRGRRVFFRDTSVGCVRCHRAEGRGGNAGPSLDGLAGSRTRGHLVESIVSPNAQLSAGHAATTITLASGHSLHGVIVADDGATLTLRSVDGTVHTVDTAEIEDRVTAASGMPGDLAEKLSRRNLRDLVEWLASLREPVVPEVSSRKASVN
jgi:quinoprotein glucose dehydrogenase